MSNDNDGCGNDGLLLGVGLLGLVFLTFIIIWLIINV